MSSQHHQLLEHSCTGVDYTLFHGSWVPCSPRLVVCGSTLSGEGVIRVYSLSGKVDTQILPRLDPHLT